MKWCAKVEIMLKPSVLDPKGKAMQKSLQKLGYPTEDIRVGKLLEIVVTSDTQKKAIKQIQAMADQMLVNPVIEEYSFALEPLEEEEQ